MHEEGLRVGEIEPVRILDALVTLAPEISEQYGMATHRDAEVTRLEAKMLETVRKGNGHVETLLDKCFTFLDDVVFLVLLDEAQVEHRNGA